jgi:hypothetical protein
MYLPAMQEVNDESIGRMDPRFRCLRDQHPASQLP